jgi:hypothetical protein
MTLDAEDGTGSLSVVSLVRSDGEPDLRESLLDKVDGGALVINLRAEADPEVLKSAVEASIAAMGGNPRAKMEHMDRFRPARPQPIHRDGGRAMTRILYCNCSYAQAVPKEVKEEVLKRLCASGAAFDAVADLCDMSARKDPAMKKLVEAGDVKIVACYPRAVKWLFHAGGRAAAQGGRRGPQHARTRRRTRSWRGCRPMNKTEGKNLRVVLYEGPGSAPLPAEDRYRAISALSRTDSKSPAPPPAARWRSPDGAPMLVLGRSRRTGAVRSTAPRCGTWRGSNADGRPRRRAGEPRESRRAQARGVEAVVPGDRLRPLHELHAVPHVLPVRSLRRRPERQAHGPEPEQLQDRLPRLLARLPRGRDPLPQVQEGARSTATSSGRRTSSARR